MFKPDYTVSKFTNLSIDRLKAQGIRLLLCDIDNTLMSYLEKDPSQEVDLFIERMQSAGIDVVFCSNAMPHRAKRFIQNLRVKDVYALSLKPSPINMWRAMHKYKVTPKQTAILGDQLMTDILGGQLAGVYTILTMPLNPHESSATSFNRKIERIVYKYLEKKYNYKRGDVDD